MVLSADASQHGLGAVCLQQGRPVAFASKALTSTESSLLRSKKQCWHSCLQQTNSMTSSMAAQSLYKVYQTVSAHDNHIKEATSHGFTPLTGYDDKTASLPSGCDLQTWQGAVCG